MLRRPRCDRAVISAAIWLCERWKPAASGVEMFIVTCTAPPPPPGADARAAVGAARQRHDRLRPGLAHQPDPAAHRKLRRPAPPRRPWRRASPGPALKPPPLAKGRIPLSRIDCTPSRQQPRRNAPVHRRHRLRSAPARPSTLPDPAQRVRQPLAVEDQPVEGPPQPRLIPSPTCPWPRGRSPSAVACMPSSSRLEGRRSRCRARPASCSRAPQLRVEPPEVAIESPPCVTPVLPALRARPRRGKRAAPSSAEPPARVRAGALRPAMPRHQHQLDRCQAPEHVAAPARRLRSQPELASAPARQPASCLPSSSGRVKVTLQQLRRRLRRRQRPALDLAPSPARPR